MSATRYLVVGLLAVCGLTACDHSSRHSATGPYTTQQVKQTFATAGIVLEPRPTTNPGRTPDLRAMFETNDGEVQVAVYKRAVSKIARSHQIVFVAITMNGEPPPESRTSRNVVVLYPRHSRPKIRRALRRLDRQ